jgi:hypothetical protein
LNDEPVDSASNCERLLEQYSLEDRQLIENVMRNYGVAAREAIQGLKNDGEYALPRYALTCFP